MQYGVASRRHGAGWRDLGGCNEVHSEGKTEKNKKKKIKRLAREQERLQPGELTRAQKRAHMSTSFDA